MLCNLQFPPCEMPQTVFLVSVHSFTFQVNPWLVKSLSLLNKHEFLRTLHHIAQASRLFYLSRDKNHFYSIQEILKFFNKLIIDLESRYDRDLYLEVQWDNIEAGKSSNFDKYPRTVAYPKYTYDFNSVMQYTLDSFGIEGRPTMVLQVYILYLVC